MTVTSLPPLSSLPNAETAGKIASTVVFGASTAALYGLWNHVETTDIPVQSVKTASGAVVDAVHRPTLVEYYETLSINGPIAATCFYVMFVVRSKFFGWQDLFFSGSDEGQKEAALYQAWLAKFTTAFSVPYNWFQVAFNLFWCLGTAYTLLQTGQPIVGAESNPPVIGVDGENTSFTGYTSLLLCQLMYLHYLNKYFELFDTVFMVAKGKAATSQMSFLHVYHHNMMIWAWWYAIRGLSGGDTWFGAFFNSFVHIVMYG